MKLECSDEIPIFWLDTTSKLASRQVSHYCLSKFKFEPFHRPERDGGAQDGGQIVQESAVSTSIFTYPSTIRCSINLLKYPHLDFMLSHKDDKVPLSPSPFNELYIFLAQSSLSFKNNFSINFLPEFSLINLLS